MAEPDDVERLVQALENTPIWSEGPKRLARIVRELLAEHVSGECADYDCGCSKAWPAIPSTWCTPCRARALRARLNAIARGEEA